MYSLWLLAFPAPVIYFPMEVLESHPLKLRWLGGNQEILVFHVPAAHYGDEENEYWKSLITYEYFAVEAGEVLVRSVPDGWVLELHDGRHFAVVMWADGHLSALSDK